MLVGDTDTVNKIVLAYSSPAPAKRCSTLDGAANYVSITTVSTLSRSDGTDMSSMATQVEGAAAVAGMTSPIKCGRRQPRDREHRGAATHHIASATGKSTNSAGL
jgi:hypothetical protein